MAGLSLCHAASRLSMWIALVAPRLAPRLARPRRRSRSFRREFCMSVKGMLVGNVGAWCRDLTADPYAILAAAGVLYGLS